MFADPLSCVQHLPGEDDSVSPTKHKRRSLPGGAGGRTPVDDYEVADFLSIGESDLAQLLARNQHKPTRVRFGAVDSPKPGGPAAPMFPDALGPFSARELPSNCVPEVWAEGESLWYRLPVVNPSLALLRDAGAGLMGRASVPVPLTSNLRKLHSSAPAGATAVCFAYPATGSLEVLDKATIGHLQEVLGLRKGATVQLRHSLKNKSGVTFAPGMSGTVFQVPGMAPGTACSIDINGELVDADRTDFWVEEAAVIALLEVGGWLYLTGGALHPEEQPSPIGRRPSAPNTGSAFGTTPPRRLSRPGAPSPGTTPGKRTSRPSPPPSPALGARQLSGGRPSPPPSPGGRLSGGGPNSPPAGARNSGGGRRRSSATPAGASLEPVPQSPQYKCAGASALAPGSLGGHLLGFEGPKRPSQGLAERCWRYGLFREVNLQHWHRAGARAFAWLPPVAPFADAAAKELMPLGGFVFSFQTLPPHSRHARWPDYDDFICFVLQPERPSYSHANPQQSFHARTSLRDGSAPVMRKWDFPHVLGPFGAASLRSALPGTEEARGKRSLAGYVLPAAGPLEPLAKASVPLCGRMAPPSPVSTTQAKKAPPGASEYRWCYPLDAAAVGIPTDVRDQLDVSAPEVRFATFGGYIYLDRSGKVVAAHAIGPGTDVYFEQPKKWWGFERHTRQLRKESRWQPVTVAQWYDAGARYLCWLTPHEDFGLGWSEVPRGGFAFLFRDPDGAADERDCFFAVAAGAPWGGLLERVRPARNQFSLVPYTDMLEEQAKELEEFDRAPTGAQPLLGARSFGKESFQREARASRKQAGAEKGLGLPAIDGAKHPDASAHNPHTETVSLPHVASGSLTSQGEGRPEGGRRASATWNRAEDLLAHLTALEGLGFSTANDAAQAGEKLWAAVADAVKPPAGAPELVVKLLLRKGIDPSGAGIRAVESAANPGHALLAYAATLPSDSPRTKRLQRLVDDHFPAAVVPAGLKRRPTAALPDSAGISVIDAYVAAGHFEALGKCGVTRVYPRMTQTLRDAVTRGQS